VLREIEVVADDASVFRDAAHGHWNAAGFQLDDVARVECAVRHGLVDQRECESRIATQRTEEAIADGCKQALSGRYADPPFDSMAETIQRAEDCRVESSLTMTSFSGRGGKILRREATSCALSKMPAFNAKAPSGREDSSNEGAWQTSAAPVRKSVVADSLWAQPCIHAKTKDRTNAELMRRIFFPDRLKASASWLGLTEIALRSDEQIMKVRLLNSISRTSHIARKQCDPCRAITARGTIYKPC
jgi:hypothetical protein